MPNNALERLHQTGGHLHTLAERLRQPVRQPTAAALSALLTRPDAYWSAVVGVLAARAASAQRADAPVSSSPPAPERDPWALLRELNPAQPVNPASLDFPAMDGWSSSDVPFPDGRPAPATTRQMPDSPEPSQRAGDFPALSSRVISDPAFPSTEDFASARSEPPGGEPVSMTELAAQLNPPVLSAGWRQSFDESSTPHADAVQMSLPPELLRTMAALNLTRPPRPSPLGAAPDAARPASASRTPTAPSPVPVPYPRPADDLPAMNTASSGVSDAPVVGAGVRLVREADAIQRVLQAQLAGTPGMSAGAQSGFEGRSITQSMPALPESPGWDTGIASLPDAAIASLPGLDLQPGTLDAAADFDTLYEALLARLELEYARNYGSAGG